MTHFIKRQVLVIALVGLFIVVPSFGKAATIDELRAQLKALLAQVATLQQQIAQQGGGVGSQLWCHTFNTNLGIGSSGDEVSALLSILVKEGFATERSSNFSGSFDEVLASAVTGFQEKYRSEILTPSGLKNGTGYAGPSTRKKLNKLYGCGGGTVQNGSLYIEPANSYLKVGETVQVQAFYRPPMPPCSTNLELFCTQVMPAPYPIQAKWTSSNSSVASISTIVGDCFTPGCVPIYIVSVNGISNGVAVIKAVYNLPSGAVLTATTNVTVTNGTTIAPKINSISPQSGPVGAQVTLAGSGFTLDKTGSSCSGNYPCVAYSEATNTMHFGPATIENVTSYDGKTLYFKVPDGYTPQCSGGIDCAEMYGQILPGTYKVYVSNANGTSNSVSFTVTGGTTLQPIQVLSPNGGETWTQGTTQTIKWQDNTQTAVSTCQVGFWCPPPPAKSYDVKLAPYYPPCTSNTCPKYPYVAPYTVASGVSGSAYIWSVGKVLNSIYEMYGDSGTAPDGSYTIQVCQSGTTTCDSSDSYFKIVSGGTSTNQPPVITGISGPTALQLNEVGTWTIKAYDPDGTVLNYGVNWGDIGTGQVLAAPSGSPTLQTATFTHSYATAGNYTVTFTASDNQGGTVKSTLTVAVGQTPTSETKMRVIFPNGGETAVKGYPVTISWTGGYPKQLDSNGVALQLVRPDGSQVGWISFGNAPSDLFSWDPAKVMSAKGYPYNIDVPVGQYLIKAMDYNSTNWQGPGVVNDDQSDAPFSIAVGVSAICPVGSVDCPAPPFR